ncbi:MAG: hypothetical protein ACI3ZY_07985, partial [Parabacteroides sp.]
QHLDGGDEHVLVKMVATLNRHGGQATLVELPKIGIHGNTHFLMQDLNNSQLANLLNDWISGHVTH